MMEFLISGQAVRWRAIAWEKGIPLRRKPCVSTMVLNEPTQFINPECRDARLASH